MKKSVLSQCGRGKLTTKVPSYHKIKYYNFKIYISVIPCLKCWWTGKCTAILYPQH